jgi:EF-P beta-lysylation protein EpmB
MITRSRPQRHTPPWRQELTQAISDPAELLAALGLDQGLLAGAQRASRLFHLRVPHSYVRRMSQGDVHDPLLRQVLPLDSECIEAADYTHDPVGDLDARVAPAVLQKYAGRALLTATGACAVHCRYCFRRHYPYAEASQRGDRWQALTEHLMRHQDIYEVILSGGDPLTLSDERLGSLARDLGDIHHLRRLRIHTRLPVVLPSRVDEALLSWLRGCALKTVLVVHVNHAREIDAAVRGALCRLGEAGVVLLNQSVLLRGVNDELSRLIELSEALFEAGVMPYYLHMLDKVQGAAHYAVEEERALALFRGLRRALPGYLVPRLARERAGEPYKLLLC